MKTNVQKSSHRRVVIPVFPDGSSDITLRLAAVLGEQACLLGLLPIPEEEHISAVAGKASQFRSQIEARYANMLPQAQVTVRVGQHLLHELNNFLGEDGEDLLVVEWPAHFEMLKCLTFELLEAVQCTVAVVRGPWPERLERILLPLRGGPSAEEAVRLARSMPHDRLRVINYTRQEADEVEAPFRGLLRVLPEMPDIDFDQVISVDFLQSIVAESNQHDLLVMGASGRKADGEGAMGTLLEQVLQKAACAVLAVKTHEPARGPWTGAEGELAGAGAISLLVDRWLAQNTYHSREFEDLERLREMKERQGISISLALPALNEEGTVGKVITTVKHALMDAVPLLDEIVLIDSRSTDRTREIAAECGVPVYIQQDILPQYGEWRGKGEALWKSLFVTRGDIVAWIDTDINNIHPRFVYSILGPLLANPGIQYVKGFYRRPQRASDRVQARGGRVTELTARPLINLFYPELSGVIQPLSGEYGGRRQALERVSFFSGYGVDTGLLIEIFEQFGLEAIAQVDLLQRVNHNRELQELSKMSFVTMQAVFHRLEQRERIHLLEDVNRTMKLVRHDSRGYYLDVEEAPEFERPPMISLPEYRATRAARTTDA